MKELCIIAVGRIKTPYWQQAADHYAKRLSFTVRLERKIVKDASADLPLAERIAAEGKKILAAIPSPSRLICLDECGKTFTSQDFSKFLGGLYANNTLPCFVIGGAFGLAQSLRQHAAYTIALGPMTFPHELAHVLLLEQLYRAECILTGSGYHH